MRTAKNGLRCLLGFLDGDARQPCQPSLAFQQATGLNNIAASYKFPKGRNATQFDLWAGNFCSFRDEDNAKETEFLQGIWDHLVALNPDLKIVQPEGNPKWIRNGIFGAASRFNPEDIRFFIELHKRTETAAVALLASHIPIYQKLSGFIHSRTGVDREWVASPETLINIHDQVKNWPVKNGLKEEFNFPNEHVPAAAMLAAQNYIAPVIADAGINLG